MTRAYVSFFEFDLASAFYYHPLFLLPVILAIIVIFRNNSFFMRLYKNNVLWVCVSAIFILLWVVRLILFFPNTPPMDYDSYAFIPRLLRMLGV